MSVHIRCKRVGRKNRPFYRIGAFDTRTARDGESIEELGHYHPLVAQADKQIVLKKERIEYWLSVGAKPSETVASILRKNGILLPAEKNAQAVSPEKAKAREERKRRREEAAARGKSAAPVPKATRKERREAKRAGN